MPEESLSKLKVITRKPIYPSDIELEENNRSRSAKLRVAQVQTKQRGGKEMATLKVYSREYGVRKVQEKVKFNLLEKTAYGVFVGVILLANVVMLNYKGEIYSLRSAQQKNDIVISEKQKNNNEQKVMINNLSSYERVKKIAETVGMKTQKDSIKVVR